MKRILPIALLIFFTVTLAAQNQKVWTGNVNNFWYEPGNWAPATVPTLTDDVIINPGNTVYLGYGPAPHQMRSLDIQGNSTLTVFFDPGIPGAYNALIYLDHTITVGLDATLGGNMNIIGFGEGEEEKIINNGSVGGTLRLEDVNVINEPTGTISAPIDAVTNAPSLPMLINRGSLVNYEENGTMLVNVKDYINDGGSVIAGTGAIVISAQNSQLNSGTFSTSFDAQIELSGNHYWEGVAFTGSGSIVNKASGNLEINTSGDRYIGEETTFINDGNFLINAPSNIVMMENSKIINNNNIDFQADNANIIDDPNDTLNAEIKLENNALIQKSGGEGTSTIAVRMQMLEPAPLVVSSGLWSLSGTLHVSNPLSIIYINEFLISLDAFLITDGEVIWTDENLNYFGTYISRGLLRLINATTKVMSNGATLMNEGTMQLESFGRLEVNDGIINNEPAGIIDFQGNGVGIKYSEGSLHILNNKGLITKTGIGLSKIEVDLNNIGGTLQSEIGELRLENSSNMTFTDGVYNVSDGATFNWNDVITISGDLTGEVNGDLNWQGTINVTATASLNMQGDGFNWFSGNILGGGILTNLNTMNLTTSFSKFLEENTTLTNNGSINVTSFGSLHLNNGIINNEPSGTIDFQGNGVGIKYSEGSLHTLNNEGLITKTGIGLSKIEVDLNNNGGTLQSEIGELRLSNSSNMNFTNGVYNVSNGATFNWNDVVAISGELTGEVNGDLNWQGTINVPATASLNMQGDGFNWFSGSIVGGGILINANTMSLTTSNVKTLGETTNLVNNGNLDFVNPGDLLLNNGVLTNSTTGIINMISNGGDIIYNSGSTHALNNEGTINVDNPGIVKIKAEFDNNGILQVFDGELQLNGDDMITNSETGIIKGIGNLRLPATELFANTGTFAPGNSPGTLTVIGDYNPLDNAILEIEIDGISQGVEYDLLTVQGNADLKGNIDIALGYAPEIDDEFVILNTTGTITNSTLPSSIIATNNSVDYNFNIEYRDNNKVVLVAKGTLGVTDEELNLNSLKIYPNPVSNVLNIKAPTQIEGEYLLFNQLGQQVLKGELIGLETKININLLADGLYTLQVKDKKNNAVTVKKIIVSD